MPQPGMYTVVASSEAWPNAGSQAERALSVGWLLDQTINSTGGEATNAAPSTSTQFLSSGDGTTGTGSGFYATNRPIRVVHGGGTFYGFCTATSVLAGQTTVTVGRPTPGGTTSLTTGSITSAGVATTWWSTAADAPFPSEVSLSSGGPTVPSLRFHGSTGTGMYLTGSNTLAVAIGGTTMMSLASTYIAIGASVPTTGVIRLPNNTSIVFNKAGGGAANVILLDNTDVLYIGADPGIGAQVAEVIIYSTQIGGAVARFGSTQQLWDLRASAMTKIRTILLDGTGHGPANGSIWGTT